jgi:SAM-dependent methyltransferase
MAPPRSADRLEREMAHHRGIADRAEKVWNWESPSGRCRADRRAGFFVSHGRLGPGKNALELGCGTGVFLEKVAPSGSRIRGIDLSIDLLLKAKDRVATLRNVCLDRGNAEELPYPDATFDTVYGSSILHHLDLDVALREAFRVLKPGGWLVFAEPNALNPQVALMFHCPPLKPHFAVSPDEKAFSRFRAARALRRLGYQSVSVRPFDFLHPSTPAGWIRAVRALGSFLESLPLVREFAGSFVIVAQKPGS